MILIGDVTTYCCLTSMPRCDRASYDLTGRICMVTGASSGIGLETAAELAGMDADVVLVVRSPTRGQQAMDEILHRYPDARVESLVADLSIVSEILRVAKEYSVRHDHLNVLVNNAGAMIGKRTETPDGLEANFAINYIAPFLLTHELLPSLLAGAPSRVVNVSSTMHTMVGLDLADLQSKKRYSGMRAYAKSKLMSLMFTYELARLLEGTGVVVNALHPGFVATGIGRASGLGFRLLMRISRFAQKSPAEGALTSIYLASSPEVEKVTGKYFVDCRPVQSSRISYDPGLRSVLWNETKKILDSLGVKCSWPAGTSSN